MLGYLDKEPFVPHDLDDLYRRKAIIPFENYSAVYQQSCKAIRQNQNVDVSRITYESDGLRVTGIEVLPHRKVGEKMPVIIFNRGGNREFSILTAPGIEKFLIPLAERMGAGVLASNYRGNDGGEGKDEFCGADVNDVLKLIEIGKKQPWWDGKNIFMIGWSRGGAQTYMAIKQGAPITAAVVGAGVTDFMDSEVRRPEMAREHQQTMPDYENRREEALKERSAICWPEKLDVPLLIVHGDADDRVDVTHARRLVEALKQHGKEVEYREYAGEGHGINRKFDQVMNETVAWFNAHKDKTREQFR